MDGISGGTITSDGVSDMLEERLSMYLPYFKKIKKANEVNRAMAEIDSVIIANDLIQQDYE